MSLGRLKPEESAIPKELADYLSEEYGWSVHGTSLRYHLGVVAIETVLLSPVLYTLDSSLRMVSENKSFIDNFTDVSSLPITIGTVAAVISGLELRRYLRGRRKKGV